MTQNITIFVLNTISDTSTETENKITPSYDIAFMDTMAYVSTAKHITHENASNDAYFSSTGGVTVVILPFVFLSLF